MSSTLKVFGRNAYPPALPLVDSQRTVSSDKFSLTPLTKGFLGRPWFHAGPTWSCPGMNVENIICFDRNVMTYKIIHRLCPNSFLEKYKPVFHATIQEIAKISKSLNIGLSAIKKAFITQLLRNGIIRLETYVSCQQ